METRTWLRDSFDRLEELGIKFQTTGYKVSGLSKTAQLMPLLVTCIKLIVEMDFVSIHFILFNANLLKLGNQTFFKVDFILLEKEILISASAGTQIRVCN